MTSPEGSIDSSPRHSSQDPSGIDSGQYSPCPSKNSNGYLYSQTFPNGHVIMNVGLSKCLVSKIKVALADAMYRDLKYCDSHYDEITPVTVIRVDNFDEVKKINRSWVQQRTAGMLASGDVISKEFVSNIIFYAESDYGAFPMVEKDVIRFEVHRGNGYSADDLPSGPHALWDGELHKVSKLYPDPYGAFMYGVLPYNESCPVGYVYFIMFLKSQSLSVEYLFFWSIFITG